MVPTVQHPDESISSTPEIVNDLLLEIDISKATGPDGISGQMLKGTAQSNAIPWTDAASAGDLEEVY